MKINNTPKEILATKVADLYQWLEDTEDPKTKKWISAQNNYLKKNISSDLYKNFSQELVKNYNFTSFSTPFSRKEKYFYIERKTGQNQCRCSGVCWLPDDSGF